MSGAALGAALCSRRELCWHERAGCAGWSCVGTSAGGGSHALLPVACDEADHAEGSYEHLERLLCQPLSGKVNRHCCRVLLSGASNTGRLPLSGAGGEARWQRGLRGLVTNSPRHQHSIAMVVQSACHRTMPAGQLNSRWSAVKATRSALPLATASSSAEATTAWAAARSAARLRWGENRRLAS